MDPRIYHYLFDDQGKFLSSDFCREQNCPEYDTWPFELMATDGIYCKKLVTFTYNITKYPKDCLHLKEIKEFEVWGNLNT